MEMKRPKRLWTRLSRSLKKLSHQPFKLCEPLPLKTPITERATGFGVPKSRYRGLRWRQLQRWPCFNMLTLKQFSDEFINWVDHSHSLEKKTRAYYRHGWNLLSSTDLANRKLDGIQHCDSDTLTFPGGPANANTALRTLRRMLAHAKDLD